MDVLVISPTNEMSNSISNSFAGMFGNSKIPGTMSFAIGDGNVTFSYKNDSSIHKAIGKSGVVLIDEWLFFGKEGLAKLEQSLFEKNMVVFSSMNEHCRFPLEFNAKSIEEIGSVLAMNTSECCDATMDSEHLEALGNERFARF